MNKKTSVIVFSKDRPLQLGGYLESLIYFSKINKGSITVIYTHSSSISYENLISEFPEINWVKENIFFEDLLSAINIANDFIIFGCDDVVFKDFFDIDVSINTLEINDDIFGFSLRLGNNIAPLPQKIDTNSNFLKWSWINCETSHWNYPWELDGTLYRREDILSIISKVNRDLIKNPNYFESEIANRVSELIPRNNLAAFIKSKCIVLTINRVQDDFENSFDSTVNTDVTSLYELYLKGCKIDYKAISKKNNSFIHVGVEFFMLSLKGYKYFNYKNSIKIFFKRFSFFIKRKIFFLFN